ncbi:MAG: DUF4785 family immunoglobulin-like domain-containing protein [Polyangiaceae bacterium]
MATTKILAVSLLPLLLAACTSDQTKTAGPVTAPQQKVPAASAVRVHGDLIPTQLVKLTIPAPTETALLHGSDALAPLKPFQLETPAEPVVGRDVHRVMAGTDPAAFTFPLDAPAGARVIVRPVDPKVSLTQVHLIEVATGRQLDRARDPSTSGINSRHVPVTPGAPLAPPADAQGAQAQAPGALTQLTELQREPGFEPLALTSRVLSFDVPATAGMVRLAVPPAIAASGVVMELQQPNTPITLSAAPGELTYAYGDTAQIVCNVASDATAIDGATVTAWVESAMRERTMELTFTAQGHGTYVATIPMTDAAPSRLGVWGIHVKASGTSGGVAFEREVDTAFGFYPAHARMTDLGTPVVTRGADGLVDEVSVDVDIETLADDRFSVRGTLTYTGADGQEHPLAAAQTGQTVAAGKATITLHFDAASLALANVDGPFHLRDVALVSQAWGFTEHRIGRGLDLATQPLAARDIRYPTVIPLAAQDLVDNGDLKLVQR